MKSFLQGRKPLNGAPLQAGAPSPAHHRVAARHPVSADHRPGPHVEVIKEGDKVVRLIVTCACGERTEVDCIYSGTKSS
jgi:hypothetical protein